MLELEPFCPSSPPVIKKHHPCAFFSRCFTPAETNYDIGNCEFLAVQEALEEWHHGLEGAKHLFVVWTDHTNLIYIKAAKHLNSRQARWALFFTRFDFLLSYRPGSKNIKAKHAETDPGGRPPDRLFVPLSFLFLKSPRMVILVPPDRASRG